MDTRIDKFFSTFEDAVAAQDQAAKCAKLIPAHNYQKIGTQYQCTGCGKTITVETVTFK